MKVIENCKLVLIEVREKQCNEQHFSASSARIEWYLIMAI
jgi:hypothetical protein